MLLQWNNSEKSLPPWAKQDLNGSNLCSAEGKRGGATTSAFSAGTGITNLDSEEYVVLCKGIIVGGITFLREILYFLQKFLLSSYVCC